MTVEYIPCHITYAASNDFIEAYAKASAQLDESEYCLRYELIQSAKEPEEFVLRIEWKLSEDHQDEFKRATDFTAFRNYIRPFLK